MGDFIPGFIIGGVLAVTLWITIDAIVDMEARPANKNIVWISKDDNLTCRKNDNYPQLNCQLVKEAIGPKLAEKPADEIVIEGEE